MPTYDYHCARCGTFEVFQSITAPTLSVCPHCGQEGLRKLLSTGGGIIFQGSGFWETDYNRSSDYAAKKKAEKSGSEPKPAADSASSSSTTSGASSASQAA
ncbi:MAG: zinc ribbon domain-containing protein [Planctomycetota bacterium]|nr:zinc ribbon domain-containing protein [Planctomycetota bacterium]MCX8040743.1 zinc ribbon domain-containing protein [Planctomycetota bacterium]MDW8373735.1 zinc ribbon domain-containing protein [Planctomycetota bacterium]